MAGVHPLAPLSRTPMCLEYVKNIKCKLIELTQWQVQLAYRKLFVAANCNSQKGRICVEIPSRALKDIGGDLIFAFHYVQFASRHSCNTHF